MRALVNGKSANYKGAWWLTHRYTENKVLILWSWMPLSFFI